ncbi:MAG: SGNH/GDSL hydrolase family protein [Gammaproteobacteria bacterium]
MKRINRLTGLVAALAVVIVAVPAAAADIDDVVFFGDSLSDTGNVWFATGGFPPPPYFQGSEGAPPEYTGGQWSDPFGPSWPTLFASRFGVTATPSVVPVPFSNNYAWGGARTGVNPDAAGVPWLDQQVALYAASLGGSEPGPGTLVSIMIGGNDVANNLGNQAALEAGIASIINQTINLYDLGIRQFLIANVPDIGATPRFREEDEARPGTAAFATAWTQRWNAALEIALDQLELPGAVIDFFDFFDFSKDPELLAVFDNTTDACLTATSICDDPPSYFYWDSFHPSSTSHALLAEGLSRKVVSTRLQQLLAAVTGVGPGKSLASKVTRAHRSYARRDTQATCGVLRAFSNQVRAQAGKQLTDAQATELGSHANTIREAIGCD